MRRLLGRAPEALAPVVLAPVALLAIALLALLGCESSPPSPTTSPSAAGSSEPAFDYLPIEATWKKRPLEIASAVAFSRGGDALHVSLSSHPLTCSDLKRGVQRVPGEVAVDLTFAPLLDHAGKTTWAVTRARFGKVTRQGNLAPVTLSTFNPQETIFAELDARIPFPPDELAVKGAFDVSGCGLMPRDDEARVIQQNELQVTLAKKPIPMNGATFEIERDGTRTLRISSEPHACGAAVGSDTALLITLPKSDVENAATPTSVRAEGYALPRPIGAKDPAALQVKAVDPNDGTPAKGPPEDGTAPTASGDARFELTGELSLSGYALTVAGTLTAQRCGAGR